MFKTLQTSQLSPICCGSLSGLFVCLVFFKHNFIHNKNSNLTFLGLEKNNFKVKYDLVQQE